MVNTPRKKCFLRLERLEARDCPTAGALDTTFAGTGIVLADFSAMADEGYSVAIQLDGKIVVAGRSQQPAPPKKNQPQTQNLFALARFDEFGVLDASFGIGGKVQTSFGSGTNTYNTNLAIQPDGKIVAAGTVDGKFALARYNINGSLDTSFDSDGLVTTTATNLNSQQTGQMGMALRPDGKILLGGKWRMVKGNNVSGGFALVRYNANGSLDTSFDGDGIATSVITGTVGSLDGIWSLALQGDGKIVAVGASGGAATVARYNSNGSLDSSFGGGDGHVELSAYKWWRDVALQSDRIVVVSATPSSSQEPARPSIARYDSSGVLDSTFGVSGLVVETSRPFTGVYSEVAIQLDGKIVVAGSTGVPGGSGTVFDAFNVARYEEDGALDASFGGGIVVTDINSNSGGDYPYDMAIQADGKIVAAGVSHDSSTTSTFAVVRYLGDDPAPLRAAATPTKISNQTITQANITPLLTEAIRRWQSAGFDVSPLTNIEVRIADLPGTTFGQAQGATITLDANAAGWGWFVDRTPADDSEFTTLGNQGEQKRMDLLTALTHEIGHVLGFDHDEGGVMAETLATGVRRMPVAGTDWLAAVEAVLYESSSFKRRS